MEFQSKFCTSCGAKNDLNAKFCCNCGNTLDTQSDQQYQNQQFHNSGYGNPYNMNYGAPYSTAYSYDGDIFGVSANEVAAFVGPKSAPKMMPDFFKKAATGSKAGFNLVVFLLGFFLGPFVMSFWFFHKRMNKIGSIILAISIALSACSLCAVSIAGDILKKAIVFTFNSEYSDTYNPYAKNANTNNYQNYDFYNFDSPFGNDDFDYYDYGYGYDFDNFTDFPSLEELGITPTQIGLAISLTAIAAIGTLALVIVCSIFANAWYLKFILSKINKLKEINPDVKLADIANEGGTCATIWVILLVSLIIISLVLSAVSFFSFLVNIGKSIY